jgi:YVTN family beta-propeller protein
LAAATGGWTSQGIPTGAQPGGVAINPVTHIAVTTDMGSGTLTVVDLNTRQLVRTIEVGGIPNGPAIDVGRNTVVYADAADNTMVFWSLDEGGGELARLPVGTNPSCVGLNEEAGVAVVAGYHEDSVVSIVDLETRTVTHTVAVAPFGNCLHYGIDPSTMTALVTSEKESTLQVIGLETGTVLRTISFPQGTLPYSASYNPRTNQAVVALPGEHSVAIVDLNSNTVTYTLPVGTGPICSVIDEARNVAYVSDMTEGSVSAVDMSRGTLLGTFVVPEAACLAYDEAQSLVLVTSLAGQVWLLRTDEFVVPTAVESQTGDAVKTRHGVHYQETGIVLTLP